jgi:hypothetical protein
LTDVARLLVDPVACGVTHQKKEANWHGGFLSRRA